MIISASRRTDLPKFHADWFMDRIRAGFCVIPNPFNHKQTTRVSLLPEDVDVIVFWTKDPRPLMGHLAELDARGYRYYFQFTVNGYPRFLEPEVPRLHEVLESFAALSQLVSPERIIWRYDPVVWSNVTDRRYHEEHFVEIAGALRGKTRRVITSLMDDYRNARRRLDRLSQAGIRFAPCSLDTGGVPELLRIMARVAAENDMEIYSCAEKYDLRPYGIPPGRCIDDAYIAETLGVTVPGKKDGSQRRECGCVRSRDIGTYGTCRHGCLYCYAIRAVGRHEQ